MTNRLIEMFFLHVDDSDAAIAASLETSGEYLEELVLSYVREVAAISLMVFYVCKPFGFCSNY